MQTQRHHLLTSPSCYRIVLHLIMDRTRKCYTELITIERECKKKKIRIIIINYRFAIFSIPIITTGGPW